MRSQRGKCCVSVKFSAGAQREYRPFVQSAARIRGRIHRQRTNRTCAVAVNASAEKPCARNVSHLPVRQISLKLSFRQFDLDRSQTGSFRGEECYSPGKNASIKASCYCARTTSYADAGSKPSNNADASLISRCICSRNNVTRFVLRKSR